MVNFWWFLSDFLSNWSDFSENVDFYIKNRVFCHFFDIKFEWKLMIFMSFFDPFLGFLGGYPSPSISAPLVVKKCLKLYIYIVVGSATPMIFIITPAGPDSWQTPKCTKMHPLWNRVFRFREGRTRSFKISSPVNLPVILKSNTPAIIDVKPVQRGENESY